jgi:hypothetical protein
MSAPKRAFLLMVLVTGCPDASDPPSGGGTSEDDDGDESTTSDDVDTTNGTTAVDTDTTTAMDSETTDGTGSTGEPQCEPLGKPEMTGPITGLQASYLAGDPMDIGVPVDEDTARVSVGVYEVGSKLYLGGNAYDIAPSSTAEIDLYAGVVGGAVGTFYIAVDLCSTSTCTTPVVRNTYQRQDRVAPLAGGETYEQTSENVGGAAMTEICPTDIPIQTFEIQ